MQGQFLSNSDLRGSISICGLRFIPTYPCNKGDDPESIWNHLSKLHETLRIGIWYFGIDLGFRVVG